MSTMKRAAGIVLGAALAMTLAGCGAGAAAGSIIECGTAEDLVVSNAVGSRTILGIKQVIDITHPGNQNGQPFPYNNAAVEIYSPATVSFEIVPCSGNCDVDPGGGGPETFLEISTNDSGVLEYEVQVNMQGQFLGVAGGTFTGALVYRFPGSSESCDLGFQLTAVP